MPRKLALSAGDAWNAIAAPPLSGAPAGPLLGPAFLSRGAMFWDCVRVPVPWHGFKLRFMKRARSPTAAAALEKRSCIVRRPWPLMQSVFHLRERAMDRSDAHLRVDQLLDLACLDLRILYTPDAGANFGYLQMLNFDRRPAHIVGVHYKES